MILPTKHLATDRSLLYIGGELLELLARPRTVSSLWHALNENRKKREEMSVITYDWFILGLDFLYGLGVVTFTEGLLRRKEAHK